MSLDDDMQLLIHVSSFKNVTADWRVTYSRLIVMCECNTPLNQLGFIACVHLQPQSRKYSLIT